MRPQNSASCGLVEMCLDLDGALAVDHREGQLEMALRIDARRQAVEFEAEMAVSGRRALRRLGDGQGPFRRRAFDEDLDRVRRTSDRRRPAALAPSFTRLTLRPDGVGADRLGHARLGGGERRLRALLAPRVERQIGAAFGRNAQLLAHRVVELEPQRHRLARLRRLDREAERSRRPCSRANCRLRR